MYFDHNNDTLIHLVLFLYLHNLFLFSTISPFYFHVPFLHVCVGTQLAIVLAIGTQVRSHLQKHGHFNITALLKKYLPSSSNH